MKGIKRFSVAALGLGVAGTLISAGMAVADPVGSPTANTRPLQGVGSDTSEEVMNGLSDAVTISSNKVISSWNATGTAFTTRPSGCAFSATGGAAPVRPNGSGAGRTALVASETVGGGPTSPEGCLDFARSSSVGGTAGSNLTYIPFAKDAVAFAVTSASNLPRQISLADLKAMYDCTYPGFEDSDTGTVGWQSQFHALLPQAGSGSRAFFYNTVLGYADSTLTGSPDTVRGCVSDEPDRSGRGTLPGIQEHRTNVLDNNSIVPVSIAQYIAQSTGTSPSFIGKGVLGSIVNNAGSVVSYPVALNTGYGTVAASGTENAPATRDIYNVVPTADLADPEVDAVFTGNDSLICLQAAVIAKYGFGTLGASCGSTTLTRNN
jgi:ABC-type phosphate transport system substrate-binding protein